MLTDDIRHADPLLNSKLLISSEHSIPTSISLGNMQLSSLFNNYTVLSFRRGSRPARAHSIRCLSDQRSPARNALFDIRIHYSLLWHGRVAGTTRSIFFVINIYVGFRIMHRPSEILSHLVACISRLECWNLRSTQRF